MSELYSTVPQREIQAAVGAVISLAKFRELLTGRQSPESQSALLGDLAMLGFRRRRGHDLRRTFITLAQVDCARRDLLETITHGPRGDIINIYTSFPWPALCAEVSKLKIELREGKVLDGDFRGLATSLATVQRTARNVG